MVYSDFTTLSKVRTAFDLTFDESSYLFTDIAAIEPSDYLKTTLNEYLPLANAINTEKARSELIIAPVLLEVRRHNASIKNRKTKLILSTELLPLARFGSSSNSLDKWFLLI